MFVRFPTVQMILITAVTRDLKRLILQSLCIVLHKQLFNFTLYTLNILNACF